MAKNKNHPGELDRSVSIYSSTSAQDSLGQPVKSWTLNGTYPARVRETMGSEAENGQEMVEDQPIMVFMRYHSTVNSTWKLVYNSETFRIISVREINRRQWTELKCIKIGDSESGD